MLTEFSVMPSFCSSLLLLPHFQWLWGELSVFEFPYFSTVCDCLSSQILFQRFLVLDILFLLLFLCAWCVRALLSSVRSSVNEIAVLHGENPLLVHSMLYTRILYLTVYRLVSYSRHRLNFSRCWLLNIFSYVLITHASYIPTFSSCTHTNTQTFIQYSA